jgi:hypothetical protein
VCVKFCVKLGRVNFFRLLYSLTLSLSARHPPSLLPANIVYKELKEFNLITSKHLIISKLYHFLYDVYQIHVLLLKGRIAIS